MTACGVCDILIAMRLYIRRIKDVSGRMLEIKVKQMIQYDY